ncbi:MAG: hypothetical protein WC635_11850 [Bacteriovorax sp.]|jgi:hypothetical protein
MKLLLLALLAFLSAHCFAETNEKLLREGHIIVVAPPIMNKDYYLLEFGFVVQKKFKPWKYEYNAYVTAALFEDWEYRTDGLRAGGLGFKGGVVAPVVSSWPLFFKLGTGFAKTVLHKSPVFGRTDQSVSRKDMFFLEAGTLYRIDRLFFSLTYQVSNVHYFSRNTFFAIGVNY